MKVRKAMKKKREKIQLSRLQIAVITLAFVVIFITSNILSLYIGLSKNPEVIKQERVSQSIVAIQEEVEAAASAAESLDYAKSEGETGNDFYTFEIWEGGRVKITTMIQYVQTPDDHTIVITDR